MWCLSEQHQSHTSIGLDRSPLDYSIKTTVLTFLIGRSVLQVFYTLLTLRLTKGATDIDERT